MTTDHVLSYQLDLIDEKIEQIRVDVAKVAEFEERLLSFRDTAGRLGDEITMVRNDTEARLRELEKNDNYKEVLFCTIVGAVGVAVGVLISILYLL